MTTVGPTATAAAQDADSNRVSEPPVQERTPWLLAFLCLLIPILPAYSVPPGPLKSNGSPARLIALILFALAVLGFVLTQRTLRTRMLRPGIVIILAYFLMMLIVYGVGLSHSDSRYVEASKTRVIIGLLANVGVALYVMARVETARQRSLLLGCLAVGLTFNCVVGLFQASTHIDLHLLFQPPGFVLNVADQGTGDALAERFGAKRAKGTSEHPIEFSVLVAVTFPLMIHFARYATNRYVRVLASVAAGVSLLAIPAGVSRSGVIALAAALLVYMWAHNLRRLATAVVAGAVALVAELVAAPRMAQALWMTIINSEEDDSVLARVADYATVSQTFRDHPVFGLGLGGSAPLEYGFLDNEWLQALVQGGAIGLLAMIVLVGGGVFGVAAALRSAKTGRERDQAYASGAMLIGIVSCTFTFDLFSFQQATLVFFILFGLLWSSFSISSRETTIPRPGADRAFVG